MSLITPSQRARSAGNYADLNLSMAWMGTRHDDAAQIAAIKQHVGQELDLIRDDLYDTDIPALAELLETGGDIRDQFHIFVDEPYQDHASEHIRLSLLWLAAIERCDVSAVHLCKSIVSATALSEGTERESRALACEAAVRVVAALMNDTHDDSDCPNPEDLSEPTPLVEIFDPFLSQSSAEPIDVTAALEPMTSPQSTRTHDEYHLPDTAAGTACSPAAITAIEKTLTSRHPWIGDQIEAIFRSQRLRALAGPVHPQFPPMLLAGPTGSGKTTLARAIAQVTGLPFWYTSAGGRSGALEFAASSPLLQRSAPSLGIRAMVSLRCVNPIIIVDDLDKFGDSRVNGDPYSALSTLVENHSSRTLVDDYLGRPVDMSQISWIFTATETSTIPGQMLDRLDVYSIDKPSPEFFDAVLALCMEDIAREAATSTWHLPSLDDAVLDALRRSYRRGRSLRRMKAALRQALGIAEGQKMIN